MSASPSATRETSPPISRRSTPERASPSLPPCGVALTHRDGAGLPSNRKKAQQAGRIAEMTRDKSSTEIATILTAVSTEACVKHIVPVAATLARRLNADVVVLHRARMAVQRLGLG